MILFSVNFVQTLCTNFVLKVNIGAFLIIGVIGLSKFPSIITHNINLILLTETLGVKLHPSMQNQKNIRFIFTMRATVPNFIGAARVFYLKLTALLVNIGAF